METPFTFGRIAVDKNFTDRSEETNQLITNFKSSVNTILISPRRWGKSSLVAKAAGVISAQDESIRFCFIDMFNIRNEEQFYKLLAEEVLKNSSSKIEGILEDIKKFISHFVPKISFSPDSTNDFSISLDWKEVRKNPDDILNLAENIGKDKKMKFIICVDEFQNLAEFDEPLAFQKKLRSNWQKHQNTTYCLYGSKRHMLC
jgi:uncharacterized protein